MGNHQVIFLVLCTSLLFQNTIQQNVSFQLIREIDRYTPENFVLSVLNIEMILFEIHAAKAVESNNDLERSLIINFGYSEARQEVLDWGLRYKKASSAKFQMANKVAVSQKLPLSQKLRLVNEVLMTSAKKYDVTKDVRPSKLMDEWLSSHLDGVLANFVQEKKLNAGENIVAISGMTVTPLWASHFQSEINRYFVNNPGTGYASKDPTCVPMMHSLSSFETMSTDEAKGIYIPFSSANLGMLILLPRKGVTCKDILDNLNNQINVEYNDHKDVHLLLPIFKEKFDYNIAKFFNGINIEDTFKDSAFKSKAKIKINNFRVNHGIRFQPILRLEVVDDIDTGKTETFEVNRPFVFVIKDKINVYAVGRIENLDGLTDKVNCSKKYADLKS
nr:accessory gland protein 76A, isoform A [Drosophila melanogaster]AAF49196.1 accessory gland protein 76A, isoform A [Drosophila melanogaster]|eukprot:NP_524153.1 accessory gland protein 76A, isoform A [Drosophila melanogaster]